MPTLKGKELVEKRNVLNEMRSGGMSLQELRFFSIYLSKINARDISSRVVKFSVSDFQKIMELGRMKIDRLKVATDSLLCKIVHIPLASGGYDSFQLFKRCRVEKAEDGEWYVEIDAHDDALPLFFEFKDRYFHYQLWNALRLKSANQLRMYEILKQYEAAGTRELTVKDLRELLGIAPNEYPRFNDFKKWVLDACQQALAENTDLKFTYEKGRSGVGGKWLSIVFHIEKNEDYRDPLCLKDFLEEPHRNEQLALPPAIKHPVRKTGKKNETEDKNAWMKDYIKVD